MSLRLLEVHHPPPNPARLPGHLEDDSRRRTGALPIAILC